MTLRKLAMVWEVNDPLPENADLIAVASAAATRERLTKGSMEISLLALEVAKKYPSALICWGSFSKNPNPDIEWREKAEIFSSNRNVFIGGVSSSTDECKAFRSAILAKKIDVRNVVVVTEGSHSRRYKRVWQHFFPNVNVCFRSVPAQKAADRKNPIWLQRYWQVWLVANICAYPLYMGNGVKRMTRFNFSQPTL